MFKILLILFYLIFGSSDAAEEGNKIDPSEYPSKDELLGKIDPSKHPDFTQIDPNISYFPEVYLRKETYQAFLEMRKAALKDGVNLTIKSGTRTFYVQRYLWNRKFIGKRPNANKYIDQKLPDSVKVSKILNYSAMPGTSRHHWGTDIDINSTAHSYFKKGEGKKVYDWLQDNAADYGFYRVYIPFGDKRKTGFQPEEWHWTYRPESEKFTVAFRETIEYSDISGFKGDDYVKSFKVIEDYVFGINPELLDQY